VSHPPGVPLYSRLAALALRRPWLLPQLLSTAWAMRGLRWYSRAPFLPLPPRSYVEWRMETAYGHEGRAPTDAELERFVTWSARMRRLARRS
jgi:hypothetical protein